MRERRLALLVMALATVLTTSLSACTEEEELAPSCAEGSLSGLCLCTAAVVDSENATISLDFSEAESVWYVTCTDYAQLSRREEDGSYTRVVNNPDCHFGCYRDGQFFPPQCNEGCDTLSFDSLQGMQRSEPLVEYVEVEQQPAPQGVELCDWYQEPDAEEMVFPVYEKRLLSGHLRMELIYSSLADCGPSTELYEDNLLEERTASYEFDLEPTGK